MFNSKFSGKIPDNVRYVMRPPSTVSDYWEHDIFDKETMGRDVRETFVVDEANATALATAQRWATDARQEIVRPNKPIEKLEIVSLQKRDNGGRAWKVLIDGAFYVDLREDVLLDCLRNAEGVAGAMLSGPFLWCSIAGHMKLVRVGSKLHEAVVTVVREWRDDCHLVG